MQVEKNYIQKLENSAKNGELRAMYHGLETHPLFSQMLLDVAADGLLTSQNRCQLVTEWIKQKIKEILGWIAPPHIDYGLKMHLLFK